MSQELAHTVWIWEGSWRFLSQYPSAKEALAVARNLRRDGEKAIYVRRGSLTDQRVRANVHEETP